MACHSIFFDFVLFVVSWSMTLKLMAIVNIGGGNWVLKILPVWCTHNHGCSTGRQIQENFFHLLLDCYPLFGISPMIGCWQLSCGGGGHSTVSLFWGRRQLSHSQCMWTVEQHTGLVMVLSGQLSDGNHCPLCLSFSNGQSISSMMWEILDIFPDLSGIMLATLF